MNCRKGAFFCVVGMLILCMVDLQAVKGLELGNPLKVVKNTQSIKQKAADDLVSDEKPVKIRETSESKGSSQKESSSKGSSMKADKEPAEEALADESTEKEIKKTASSKSRSKKTNEKDISDAIEELNDLEDPLPSKPSFFSRIINSNIMKIILVAAGICGVILAILMVCLLYLSKYIQERDNRLKYMESLKPAYTSMGSKKDAMLAAMDE